MDEDDDGAQEAPPAVIDTRSAPDDGAGTTPADSFEPITLAGARDGTPAWRLVLPAIFALALIGLVLIETDPDAPPPLAYDESTATTVPRGDQDATTTVPRVDETSTSTGSSRSGQAPSQGSSTTPPRSTTSPPAPTAERGAVYRDGKLYLEGAVPDRRVARRFFEKAAAVIGEDNVIDNYHIDPSAPVPTDGRVTVDEPFLFETASAEISREYSSILDLGGIVMSQNPQVTMHIIGHTDAVGSRADNQALSVARARAVADYLVFIGVERSRLATIGRGETEPIASNATPEGRRLNRRIEVELVGLLS